jgi:hypothetical protein
VKQLSFKNKCWKNNKHIQRSWLCVDFQLRTGSRIQSNNVVLAMRMSFNCSWSFGGSRMPRAESQKSHKNAFGVSSKSKVLRVLCQPTFSGSHQLKIIASIISIVFSSSVVKLLNFLFTLKWPHTTHTLFGYISSQISTFDWVVRH